MNDQPERIETFLRRVLRHYQGAGTPGIGNHRNHFSEIGGGGFLDWLGINLHSS
jgi:hypothetical protein